MSLQVVVSHKPSADDCCCEDSPLVRFLPAALMDRTTDIREHFLEGNVELFRKALPTSSAGWNVIDPFGFQWFENDVRNLPFLEAMLDAGLDLNRLSKTDGKAAIHYVVEAGNLRQLKVLVARGADVNLLTDSGDTALHCVIKTCSDEHILPCKAHLGCFQYLLQREVYPDMSNKEGLTPLHCVAKCFGERGFIYMEKLLQLCKDRLNIDMIRVDGATARDTLYKLNCKLDLPTEQQPCQDVELFKIVNTGDDDMFCKALGQEENAHLLFKCHDQRQWTLLQHACYFGMVTSVQELLRRGADVNLTGDEGVSAVHLACGGGHSTVLELLMARRNLRLARNNRKQNVLHVAVQCGKDSPGYARCLRILLASDAIDVNEQDIAGRTPLHYAVMYGNDDGVRQLLEWGARIDIKDHFGQKQVKNMSFWTLKKYLDSQVTSNDKAPKDPNFEMRLDYSRILRKEKTSKFGTVYGFPMDLLDEIKHTEHLRNLVSHPLFSLIISIKWRILGKIFYASLLVYIFFCLSFTSNVLHWVHGHHDIPSYVFSWLGLLLMLFSELFFIVAQPRSYVSSPGCLLRILVILLTCFVLLLSCTFTPYQPSPTQSNVTNSTWGECVQHTMCPHVVPLAVLITWCELFYVLGKHPSLTFYVNIFKLSTTQLLKFILVHVPIMVGFALSFHVFFGRSDVMEESNPFSNPIEAIFKTFVMLTGEYDVSSIPFGFVPYTSHLVFVSFVCSITIVLLNLLIGLASSATKDVEDRPFQHDCASQVSIIQRCEAAFFSASNATQHLLHKLFLRKLLEKLLGLTYGQIEDFEEQDCLVTIRPNAGNEIAKFFIFSFDKNHNGLIIKTVKKNKKLILDPHTQGRIQEILCNRKNKAKVWDIKDTAANLMEEVKNCRKDVSLLSTRSAATEERLEQLMQLVLTQNQVLEELRGAQRTNTTTELEKESSAILS